MEVKPDNLHAYAQREPVRVVVIEDNAPDVMLVGESLSAQSILYELTHYKDGVEAVRMLCGSGNGFVPDLIVLDLNMPRMGGLEVLAHLKENKSLSKVPIAILTSSLAPEERNEADRLGADRFLRKPVDLYEYLSEVGGMLRELIPEDRLNAGAGAPDL